MGGHKPFALARHQKLVRDLVAAQSDLTLEELRDRLVAAGVVVGRTSIHRYLEALGLTHKKKRSMPLARSPGCRRGARGMAEDLPG